MGNTFRVKRMKWPRSVFKSIKFTNIFSLGLITLEQTTKTHVSQQRCCRTINQKYAVWWLDRMCFLRCAFVMHLFLDYVVVSGRCHDWGGPDPHSHAPTADDAGRLPQPDAQRCEPPDLGHTPLPQLLQRQILWSDDGETLQHLLLLSLFCLFVWHVRALCLSLSMGTPAQHKHLIFWAASTFSPCRQLSETKTSEEAKPAELESSTALWTQFCVSCN